MPAAKRISLKTARETLLFDARSARLISLRSKLAPDQEFIASTPEHPALLLHYLDDQRQLRQISSLQAEETQVECATNGPIQVLEARFLRLAGQDLEATLVIRASRREPMTRWSLSLRNGAGLEIFDVQFPFVVCRYQLAGTAGNEAVLLPQGIGRLIQAPTFEKLGPDCRHAWEFTSSNTDFDHYPGGQFAQFAAYYNDRAGLYLACEDSEGNVKRFKALHRKPGLRLGLSHVGDWPRMGGRDLEYETVLGSFAGDWHDAASLYRDWSLRQKWGTPLHRRQDVPAWLLDSPVHITIRPQGVLDAGPVFPVAEFLPYEKCIPLLERISNKVGAPLVAVIMGWERGASWVYPDCFPPVGGDESVTRFAAMARQRGWHVGSFCNGTRWVVGHFWNDYDGRAYYAEHQGQKAVCREADGSPWKELWDQGWRPSFACCLGTAPTRQIAQDFVRRLLKWGLESIQFFDQNIGAATFPCFAQDHEHPPLPGKWMAAAMEQMIRQFHQAARDLGETGVIHSVETCTSEYGLPLFQQSDSRLTPPGHMPHLGSIPLYQFLFHECLIMHGMMGHAPEPYHLSIRNAANAVYGQIPGGVMVGDGTLLNKDTGNWAPWEPRVGSDDDALEMIRTVTALRRSPGRDFLLFGRMLKPAAIRGIRIVEWEHGGTDHRIPAVFHAAWQAPDGRFAVALANWTRKRQEVSIEDERLGSATTLRLSGRKLGTNPLAPARGRFVVGLPPLSCALVEADS